jgi:hypothetical protein
MRFGSSLLMVGSSLMTACCGSVAPPPSQLPNAQAAIDRMRATYMCANAVKATSAKLVYFGDRGRFRAEMNLETARPANLRMDVYAPPPLSSALKTLTSDGERFALRAIDEKRFYTGPAQACNIARLTNVPVPGFVLGELLRGQAPILRHDPAAATISWDGSGYYVVSIPSTVNASQEIHLTPRPEDWSKPWQSQRLRVVDVVVKQEGFTLYHAELDEHAQAPMDKPMLPSFPGDPGVPLSGPDCDAELPRKIHVEMPVSGDDVEFRYDDKQVYWNPPLPPGQFQQQIEPGLQLVPVTCSDQR